MDSSSEPDRREQVYIPHDPNRIRGDALRRSLRANFLCWIPGAFWMGATAALTTTELGKYLGANDLSFALLLTAAPAFAALFQVVGMVVTEHLGARKTFFLWMVSSHRLLYCVIGLLPWIVPSQARSSALLMVLIVLVSNSLSQIGAQAWVNWMADLVPARVRGKHFAKRGRVGLMVIACTMVAVALLMDWSRTLGFEEVLKPVSDFAGMPALIVIISGIFMVAGFVGMFDPLYLLNADEPPMRPPPDEPLWVRLTKPLTDRPFARFLAYWALWFAAISFPGWLWWPYLLKELEQMKAAANPSWFARHMYLTATLILGASFQLGQISSYPIWGRAVDRFGRKPIFFISSAFHTFGWVLWIFLSPSVIPFLFLTQFCSGFCSGGYDIAFFNMQLQFNRRGGAGYQAVCGAIVNFAGTVSAVVAGCLAHSLEEHNSCYTIFAGTSWEHTFNHYPLIIAIGMVMKMTADFAVLPRVIDVGGRSRRHALQFVLDNMYGQINTLIFEPIKTGVELTGKGLTGVKETLSDSLSDAGDEIRRWWQ